MLDREPRTARVVSIGYERRTVEELIEILLSHKVQKLIDIREAPISRRKGFSKNILASQLDQAGIEYRHLRPAGNPYRREAGDIPLCLHLYEAYLWQNPKVVDLVFGEASTCPVAILCYEREQNCCHRSVLFREMQRRGYRLEVVEVG